MKTLRLAIASGLVLAAGAATAAPKSPPIIDLTLPCCQDPAHKAQHEKAYQLAAQAPYSERGRVLAENWCDHVKSPPYKDLSSPKTAQR